MMDDKPESKQKPLQINELDHFLKCPGCGQPVAIGDAGLVCMSCNHPIITPRIKDRKNSYVLRRMRAIWPHLVIERDRSPADVLKQLGIK